MRVYEAAKLLDMSNKELIELLSKHGLPVKSHMSGLSEEALVFVEQEIKKNKSNLAAPAAKDESQMSNQYTHEETEKTSLVDEQAQPKKIIEPVNSEPEVTADKQVLIEPLSVGELALRLGRYASEVILYLLKKGIVSTKNQILDEKVVEEVVTQFGFVPQFPDKLSTASLVEKARVASRGMSRPPIVAVLGHVDHGKTTLLDFIRKTKVADKEHGGITQHLGAYEVLTPQGKLIFLDTPGHEAFSNIRGRSVAVADLAILIIAADDGVMPQTVEAIKRIKQAGMPVVVAINKVDRVDSSKINDVMSGLARYDLLPEEWGGDIVTVPIVATTGQGIDRLLEMVVLQGQFMDLQADEKLPATGFVLESQLEKGLGVVATVICQQGMLKQGDYFSAGHAVGRVVSMQDSYGVKLKEVGPSVPVKVAGFSQLPHAGEHFEVVSKNKYNALRSSSGEYKKRQAISGVMSPDVNVLNVVLKCDSSSTKEALVGSLKSISAALNDDVALNIVYAGVGNISESDIVLAVDTAALVVGLHVKVDSGAWGVSQKNLIHIHQFDIIYKLLEFVEEKLEKKKSVKLVEKRVGQAVVRKVFAVKNLGVIAGAYVKDGKILREGKLVVFRSNEKVGEGKIKSLERERRSMKEVAAGFECAFIVDGYSDWQVDDVVECVIEVPA